MFQLPSPLHPAIVHFPIVLTLLGTLFSIFAVITRRGALPQLTALILILAAGSAQYAVYTGNDQDPMFGTLPEEMRALVREHSEWGERARNVVAIAAGEAVSTGRDSRSARPRGVDAGSGEECSAAPGRFGRSRPRSICSIVANRGPRFIFIQFCKE